MHAGDYNGVEPVAVHKCFELSERQLGEKAVVDAQREARAAAAAAGEMESTEVPTRRLAVDRDLKVAERLQYQQTVSTQPTKEGHGAWAAVRAGAYAPRAAMDDL